MNPVRRFEKPFIAAVAAVLFVGLSLELNASRLPQGLVRQVKRITFALASKPRATVKLSVPFHRQEHALSCEAAALYTALSARGVAVTEGALIDAIGFDPTPKRDRVWGDPDVAFVGNIDGRQPQTGYGVYWEPIARVANRFRRAEAETGRPVAYLARQIADGNPVIVWGFIRGGQPYSWKTPAGKTVPAVVGEHARVAIGFSGTKEYPTGFFLMDPTYGEIYMDRATFDRNWSALSRGMVVVY